MVYGFSLPRADGSNGHSAVSWAALTSSDLTAGREAPTLTAYSAHRLKDARPRTDPADIRTAADRALAPFAIENGGENPYTIQKDLQETMQRLVGIIRKREELQESLVEIDKLKQRAKKLAVEGHRQYNPGWHLAIDLTNQLIVSECIAKAALEREESRGGHTRDDFPGPDDGWGQVNLVLTLTGGDFSAPVHLEHQPLPVMPDELKELFD